MKQCMVNRAKCEVRSLYKLLQYRVVMTQPLEDVSPLSSILLCNTLRVSLCVNNTVRRGFVSPQTVTTDGVY